MLHTSTQNTSYSKALFWAQRLFSQIEAEIEQKNKKADLKAMCAFAGLNSDIELSQLILENEDRPDLYDRVLYYLEAQKKQCFRVRLEACNMTRIPSVFFSFSNLMTLDVSHNQLKTIPKEINRLQKLAKLIISHNQITKISQLQLPCLQVIHAENNAIESVNLTSLQALEEIYLKHNPIQAITLHERRALKADITVICLVTPTNRRSRRHRYHPYI